MRDGGNGDGVVWLAMQHAGDPWQVGWVLFIGQEGSASIEARARDWQEGDRKHSFFGKKEQKTSAALAPNAQVTCGMSRNAKVVMKFFWFFLFTKRTTWLLNSFGFLFTAS